MRAIPSTWTLPLLTLALAAGARAQGTGYHLLYGREGRDEAEVELLVRRPAPDRLQVLRRSRPPGVGAAYREWSSTVASPQGAVLEVDYELGAGLAAALSGPGERLRARYEWYPDGRVEERLTRRTQAGLVRWRTARTLGRRLEPDPDRRVAQRVQGLLAEWLIAWRRDHGDGYAPGDAAVTAADLRAARRLFADAVWEPVPVPAGVAATRALRARPLADPRDLLPGLEALVLLEASGALAALGLRGGATTWLDDGTSVSAPPPTPAPTACPAGSPTPTLAELEQRGRAAAPDLTWFVMTLRRDTFECYGPGDGALFLADRGRVWRYFAGASFREVPVPAGRQAARALEVVAADPDGVIEGTITLLFGCQGQLVDQLYLKDGVVFDDDDV